MHKYACCYVFRNYQHIRLKFTDLALYLKMAIKHSFHFYSITSFSLSDRDLYKVIPTSFHNIFKDSKSVVNLTIYWLTPNNCFGLKKRSTTLLQAKTVKDECRNVTATYLPTHLHTLIPTYHVFHCHITIY